MKKTYLFFLLTLCSFQLLAQKPSALNEKAFKEKIIDQVWGNMDSVTYEMRNIYFSDDSLTYFYMNWIEGGYERTFSYQFIQIKENIFELALFLEGKNVGYLYGYKWGKNKLSILCEEERQKISTGLPTGGTWETYEH